MDRKKCEISLNLSEKGSSECDKNEFIKNWMNDAEFEAESIVNSEDVPSELNEIANLNLDDSSHQINNRVIKIFTNEGELDSSNNKNILQQIFNSNFNQQSFGNFEIVNSEVHLGNIINVSGSICIIDNKKSTKDLGTEDWTYEAEISDIGGLRMLSRKTWSTYEPIEPYEYLKQPATYVIICHTVTQSAVTVAKSVELVRNIQSYHLNTRTWNDIGYNFLISNDGVVYEGRGWGIQGAHSRGFNEKSVAIAFVGNFIHQLPVQKSLDACKSLIQIGVDKNFIKSNYKLVGHCQCINAESPGRMLFNEIQEWKNYSPIL